MVFQLVDTLNLFPTQSALTFISHTLYKRLHIFFLAHGHAKKFPTRECQKFFWNSQVALGNFSNQRGGAANIFILFHLNKTEILGLVILKIKFMKILVFYSAK